MAEAVLNVSLPRCEHLASGKVRELFAAGDGIVLISTDRVSAFDVIMNQGIPGRGIVLTRLSQFWFDRFESLIPHHLITTDLDAMPEEVRDDAAKMRGRTMYAHKLEIVPVECVVRGYLAGSGWKEYQQSQSVCGVPLPEGLLNSSKLPEPIFTPTTKATSGHDMPMTFAEVEGLLGADRAHELRRVSLEIYQAGADYAATRGILLADTKFEFGTRPDGTLVLADEVLTPDSSRYWDAATYEPGRSQDSFDKQIIRDWLEATDWNKQPPPPTIPEEILEKAAGRYEEIADRLMR